MNDEIKYGGTCKQGNNPIDCQQCQYERDAERYPEPRKLWEYMVEYRRRPNADEMIAEWERGQELLADDKPIKTCGGSPIYGGELDPNKEIKDQLSYRISKGGLALCFNCRGYSTVNEMYKCFYCGVFYCRHCSEKHFRQHDVSDKCATCRHSYEKKER